MNVSKIGLVIWIGISGAFVAMGAANASCDDRPGTPTNVTMETTSSTELTMRFTDTAGGWVWYDMYLDFEGGPNAGRNITGGTPDFHYQVKRGDRLQFTWRSLEPNRSYCAALRARSSRGTNGCVSLITSNWACARTLAEAEPLIEAKVDRPGYDLFNFSTGNYGPELQMSESCNAACERDSRCKAWTFVRPGVQGRYGRCYLKSAVPKRVFSDCCTSGYKFGSAHIQ